MLGAGVRVADPIPDGGRLLSRFRPPSVNQRATPARGVALPFVLVVLPVSSRGVMDREPALPLLVSTRGAGGEVMKFPMGNAMNDQMNRD